MNPEPGRRFGPYEIQSRLGGGGMGHVYRAWDARLHREVAMKLLNHEYAMPGMRERFLREARAASALNHPNICTIFDIGEQDGDPYLVMELLQGETLRDRMFREALRLDEIISIAKDAAEALGAAHSKGVVHRDIKPANIFLVEKPNGGTQAKVLDFGLAKIEGGSLGARGRSLDITTVGATVGTLAYMSPEQARGEQLDSRSDLFSLGVVLYEMATGQVPFQGATSALVFVQLLNHPPEPVREWNDAIPRDLEKIILKLLAKERTARFQTAHELELALAALNEKGSSGGWLRKAVATVPLVRSHDPVARGKHPSRAKLSTDPGLQSAPQLFTPAPGAASSNGEKLLKSSSPGEQILRPVARIPRPETTPVPGRNTPAPSGGVQGTSAPVPASTRSSGGQTPEERLTKNRIILNTVNAEEPSTLSSISDGTLGSQAKPIGLPAAAIDTGEETPRDSSFSLDSTPEINPDFDETFPLLITPDSPHRRSHLPFHPLWLGLSGLATILIACALFVYLNPTHFSAVALIRGDVVVLTEIENRTGDKILDESITEALYFELAQSPYFTLRSRDSYRAARRVLALAAQGPTNGITIIGRKISERLGAKAYIVGSLTGSTAPYTLHLDLRDVRSNDILVSAEAHPSSLQQVPSAIDQVASDLRIAAGEPRSAVDATSAPLASEASSNLAAIQLYAEAESLISSREPVGALADLQQAVTLDPKFIQAQLRLADLYHQLRAETAAADSARLALAATGAASDRTRTLAQVVYEREATGDYLHAASLLRHLLNVYPHDPKVLTLLAESLRLQDHMAEALTFSQQAYSEAPLDAAPYSEAEMELIGLDRYDAAYQLNLQAQRLTLSSAADSLATADLDGHQEVINNLLANLTVGKIEYRPDWTYGIYLDNVGRLAAGASLWQSRAAAAQQNESLKSAAAFLLAQGALDRALLGECTAALAMLPPIDGAAASLLGRTALFNAGVTLATCGERAAADLLVTKMRRDYPQSFEVNGFFIPDIQAAEDLHDKLPAAALDDLAAARAFDLISISPYLRGQAHIQQHETALGIVDYQTELAHRGIIYLVGNDIFPAAQIGVARAFAQSGDAGNSAEAYRTFLKLWNTADSESPVLKEAKVHSGT